MRSRGVSVSGAENAPSPAALRALTEHCAATSLVSPVTMRGLAVPVVLRVFDPDEHRAVYAVISAPPSFDGGSKLTTRLAISGARLVTVGAPGSVRGVTLGAEAAVP